MAFLHIQDPEESSFLQVRPANEDAIALDTRILTGDMSTPVIVTTLGNGCLLMVADGMGGHAQDARASRAGAVRIFTSGKAALDDSARM